VTKGPSAPHITPSPTQGLIGGGIIPRPGEVSLAHNGLLSSTNCGVPAQCSRSVAPASPKITPSPSRALHVAHISRALHACGAMNPCPCGYFNDKSRECMCTPPMIQRYIAKISGPLLDRIDIHIEVPAVRYKELRGSAAIEGSAEIRARVLAARERQRVRFHKANEKIYSNAQMTRADRVYCELGSKPRTCSNEPCSSKDSPPVPRPHP